MNCLHCARGGDRVPVLGAGTWRQGACAGCWGCARGGVPVPGAGAGPCELAVRMVETGCRVLAVRMVETGCRTLAVRMVDRVPVLGVGAGGCELVCRRWLQPLLRQMRLGFPYKLVEVLVAMRMNLFSHTRRGQAPQKHPGHKQQPIQAVHLSPKLLATLTGLSARGTAASKTAACFSVVLPSTHCILPS